MSDGNKGNPPPKNLAGLLGILSALMPPPGYGPMPGDPFGLGVLPDFGPNPFDDRGFRKPEFDKVDFDKAFKLQNFPPLPNRPPDLMVLEITKVVPTSKTMTRKRLMADLRPIYVNAIMLCADEIAMGQLSPKDYVLRNKSDDDLIDEWNRCCAPDYFAKNPGIEDVLLDKGIGGKVWVASRPKPIR